MPLIGYPVRGHFFFNSGVPAIAKRLPSMLTLPTWGRPEMETHKSTQNNCNRGGEQRRSSQGGFLPTGMVATHPGQVKVFP